LIALIVAACAVGAACWSGFDEIEWVLLAMGAFMVFLARSNVPERVANAMALYSAFYEEVFRSLTEQLNWPNAPRQYPFMNEIRVPAQVIRTSFAWMAIILLLVLAFRILSQ
jgi:hypothetical protein